MKRTMTTLAVLMVLGATGFAGRTTMTAPSPTLVAMQAGDKATPKPAPRPAPRPCPKGTACPAD